MADEWFKLTHSHHSHSATYVTGYYAGLFTGSEG
jgi:hypothetical protein